MRNYALGIIGGDGIGPEVTEQSVRAVSAAAERFGFRVNFSDYDLGGRRYQRTGEVLPASVVDELREQDAILFGAIGTPEVRPGILERGLILELRVIFDQFVNLRPIKLLPGVVSPVRDLTPERVDFVVIRENNEGLYPGAGGIAYEGTPAEVATQEAINTRYGVERVIRDAFSRAQDRRGRLTLCHKMNVLAHAGSLWKRTFDEVAADFPDVEVGYVHVDAACLYFVNSPERFDVIVTDSMFGDIITDLGAAVIGGLGFAGSGNINPERTAPSMFEPIHGSAPDIAGRRIANPIAAVLAAGLCLEHLGEQEAAQALEDAVIDVIPRIGLADGGGTVASTDEIGDRIAEFVAGGTKDRSAALSESR